MTMISTETQAGLARLESGQNNYLPGSAIAAQIGHKSLYCIVGPSSVGKSYLMRQIVEDARSIEIAGTLTSRQPRPDDAGKSYRYVSHDDDGLQPLIERVLSRQLVQYTIHPFTKRLYGTEICDYPADHHLMDVLATSVDGLRRVPYQSMLVVGIVSDHHEWWSRFNDRFPIGHPDRSKRHDEAIVSLDWMRRQQGDTVHLVRHVADQEQTAIEQIMDIVAGSHSKALERDGRIGRQLASMMLTHALEMKQFDATYRFDNTDMDIV